MIQTTLNKSIRWNGKEYPANQPVSVPDDLGVLLGLIKPDFDPLLGVKRFRASTTNATPSAMVLAGTNKAGLSIPVGAAYIFTGFVWGFIPANGDIGGWEISGIISNVAGTTTLSGAITPAPLPGLPSGWALGVTADDANNALVLTVTGVAATGIEWRSELRILQELVVQ